MHNLRKNVKTTSKKKRGEKTRRLKVFNSRFSFTMKQSTTNGKEISVKIASKNVNFNDGQGNYLHNLYGKSLANGTTAGRGGGGGRGRGLSLTI